MKQIAINLEKLRKRGYLLQTTPLDFKINSFTPGDWVLIRRWKDSPLSVKWEGPFQVLLTTESAVHTQEKGWTQAIRVKGPVPEPTEWTVENQEDVKLTLRRKRPRVVNCYILMLLM